MPAEQMARLNPAAITLASGQKPFTLRPLIKEMLRTRRCIAGSVFIVEGIDLIPLPGLEASQAIRLLLGDGELCVQALLQNEMFGMVHSEEVWVGCYVQVEELMIRFEEPSGSPPDDVDEEEESCRTMVYLMVNELRTIGWNEPYKAMWRRAQKGMMMMEVERSAAAKDSPLRNEEEDEQSIKAIDMTKAQNPKRSRPSPKANVEKSKNDDANIDDDFETLEALTLPSRQPSKRSCTSGSMNSSTTATSKPPKPVALPRYWHDHQVPLKLTTLRSIPHLPYVQNWSVNVLAIIASLSPVEASYPRPGMQRTARIADPSTAKQVHLTVFLAPESFNPSVGSAVLLTGVKNHRFDGGSLKKYASDGGKGGARWWFEDPREMRWLDVAGIKAWWAEMEEYLAQDKP